MTEHAKTGTGLLKIIAVLLPSVLSAGAYSQTVSEQAIASGTSADSIGCIENTSSYKAFYSANDLNG